MKKLSILLLLITPFFAMSQKKAGSAAQYKATYSSNFVMDDAKYSNVILTLWKDFEDNTLDKHRSFFSDTITMLLADGKKVKGLENNLKGVKQSRNALKNYKTSVVAYMSIKSVDENKHFVTIWGDDNFTDKNGKKATVHTHEIWGFNKDGKVDYMAQYTAM